MTATRTALGAAVCCLTLGAMAARADVAPEHDAATGTSVATGTTAADTPVIAADGLEHLVPELAANPYALEPGVRPYLNRLSISPGFGLLGSQRLFVLRAAYNPNAWLGYEASIGHNPSHSVQGILHRFSAIVRRPLAGRFQPYASAGYGMTIVLPGRSLNADPVTKNALTLGGGLECFIRRDLALRAELLGMTVIGRQQYRQGTVAYEYREATIALAFYRTLAP